MNEADLPDEEYESIYGAQACFERLCTRLAMIEQRNAAVLRQMDRGQAASEHTSLPYAPEHYTYAIRWFPDAQCFRATVAEFPHLRARGSTPTGTLLAIIEAVAQYLRTQSAAGHTIPAPGHTPAR